jgi:hypothetical protein
MGELSETSMKIGKIIADNLVDDGATLQMGIGGVPDAALAALTGHKDLGVHTEMLSDGILPLVECNAVTNAKKYHHAGRIVTSFVYGSKKLYDFLDNNPMVHFGGRSIQYLRLKKKTNSSNSLKSITKIKSTNFCSLSISHRVPKIEQESLCVHPFARSFLVHFFARFSGL